MPITTERSQIAQLMQELVDGHLMEELNDKDLTEDELSLREELDAKLEAQLRHNAEARRLACIATRNKMLD